MKGNVIMRFVGNRQEPEEFLKAPDGTLYPDPITELCLQRMDELNDWIQEQVWGKRKEQ